MFTKPWTQDERKNKGITVISGYPQYEHCAERIWTTEDPYNPKVVLNTYLEKELRTNRKEGCYFLQYRPDIAYDVAKELQPKQLESRILESTNRNVKLGWLIVIVMGAISLITQVVLHFLKQNPSVGQ